MGKRILVLTLVVSFLLSSLTFAGVLRKQKASIRGAKQRVYVHRVVTQHVDLGVVDVYNTVDHGTVSYYIYRYGHNTPTLNGTSMSESAINDILDDYGISVPWRTYGDWDSHTVLSGVTGTKTWQVVTTESRTWTETSQTQETQSNGSIEITIVTTTVTTYSQTIRTTTTHRETASVTYVQTDPLILDLDGNGKPDVPRGITYPHPQFFVSSARAFDINGDGLLDLVEWLGPNDGLLAVLNERGIISSALDLFGNAIGYAHGFQKLATLDENGDGYLTGKELNSLVVWRDLNGDAVAQENEITPVKALGIVKISVTPDDDMKSYYETAEGKRYLIWEWWPNAYLGIGVKK